MSSEGAFTTAEGNDWDFYSDARNPHWPSIKKVIFNDEDCIEFVLTNFYPDINLTSLFEIEGTIKTVMIRAGGNLGRIEIHDHDRGQSPV